MIQKGSLGGAARLRIVDGATEVRANNAAHWDLADPTPVSDVVEGLWWRASVAPRALGVVVDKS